MTGVDVCFLRLHIFIAAEQINLFAEASELFSCQRRAATLF